MDTVQVKSSLERETLNGTPMGAKTVSPASETTSYPETDTGATRAGELVKRVEVGLPTSSRLHQVFGNLPCERRK